jgi:hypothetical protein
VKINIILRVCALLSLIIFLTYSINKISPITHGFTAYYTFSRMLLEGDDLSRSYDDNYFNSKINEYGIKNIYDVQHNLPTTAFAYLPVSWLQPSAAKLTWGILSIVLVFIAIALLLIVFDIRPAENPGLLLIILIFLWHPLYENIVLGQIYILLLFLFLLGLLGIKKKNASPASFAIAINVVLKGYGLILYLWMLITKRLRMFTLSILILVVIVLIILPIINFHTWRTYFDFASTSLGRSAYDSNTAYQSVNGFIRHLFVYDKVLNPNALLNLSGGVVFLISVIVNLSIVIFLLFKARSYRNNTYLSLLAFSALIGASVITSPVAEEHPYVLFLPLAAGLIRSLFTKSTLPIKILFVFSLLLIIIPIHYKTLELSAFPVYLLAYPKLYGGSIMLSLYAFCDRYIADKVTNN